jgi:hypothetical protein
MPAVGGPKNTVTTQPMSMPARPVAPPVAPNQKQRATQRLVVTPLAAGKMTASRPLVPPVGSGSTINLPVGMILRCLPPDMLSGSLAEFENSGAAATEIPLPINSILSQLPSGKVEMTVRDLAAHIPPGFLKPAGEIASYMSILASLPLMDVVMRIPPDLLAVRPDQKDVDPNVRRMADPFSEEALRQAAAPKPAEAKIVDESQVPATEEFVPQASTPARSFVPPPRTAAPAAPLLQQTSSLSGRPMLRATAPMPGRILPPAPDEIPTPPRPPQLSASQMLGVPRPSIAPPTVTPQPPYGATATGPIAPKVSEAPAVPQIPPPPPQAATASLPPPPTNSAELQRLAALAMAEIATQPVVEKVEEKMEEKLPMAPFDPEPEKPAFTAPSASTPASAVPNLQQFAFKPPTPAPATPAVTEKVEPGFAATSRLKLPEFPVRELSQTAPLAPATPDLIRTPATPEPVRATPAAEPVSSAAPPARTAPPVPSSSFLTESQILPQSAQSAATAVNLNNCSADDLLPIPGMTRPLAAAIVQHRDKIGEFHKLEELLDVPGMTSEAYSNLTGETPSSGVHPTINELLGFPLDRELSLKDITDRIVCWPDVTGCLLSQKNGLHLVGTAPDFLDKEAIVAFAPRMFEDVNKSFTEITGKQTDELIIPTTGTSFHLLRERDLYLIILSRLPQMPERHLKIARFVLAGLSARPG